MATKKKSNKKRGKGGRIALGIILGMILAVGAAIGISALNANTIHVRRADVCLSDLPPEFDGKTILYASDIDLCGINTAKKSAVLFHRLQSLNPDILILGGDYTSSSVFDILNSEDGKSAGVENAAKARSDFLHYITDFSAPLGKFAIAGPEDADLPELARLMSDSGIQPLLNSSAFVRIGSAQLGIAGYSDETSLSVAGDVCQKEDFVIAVVPSPDLYPRIVTGEAKNSGPWADLILSGHTHGGQITLFGRSVIALSSREQQHMSGWTVENGLPMLISSGVGCEGANLRINSRAEVWLLTLRQKKTETPTDPVAGEIFEP